MRVRAGIAAFAPWGRVLREVIWAAATGIATLIIGVLTLGINFSNIAMRWQTNIADDQTQHYLVAKTVTDDPLLGPNSLMGFPTTQNLFFAPNYDPASAMFMDFEALFTRDAVLILNIYHVIGFFSVAFAAYFFFRALRVRRWIGIFFAMVFALAPYHFQRIGFGHAFVANYWAVALLGILVLVVASPRTDPFEGWVRSATSRRMMLWRRVLPIVVLTLLVSLSLSYYYVFAAIILGGLLIARLIRKLAERDQWRSLLWPFVTVAALGLFIVVQLGILSLNFGDRYSKYFAIRSPSESEIQAGKITTLLLPWQGSGFTPFAAITSKYVAKSTVSVFAEPPGTPMVAAIAMLLIIAFVLVRLLRLRALPSSRLGSFLADERAGAMAFAFFWGLLFFVVTGLGAIFAFLVSPEIRSWARMAIVLTVVALGFLAVLVDSVLRSLKVAIPVVAVLALIAIVDQLAGVHGAIHLQPTDDASLRSFVRSSERLLPAGCGVVQLPLKKYPATGNIGLMNDYDEALPYIVSSKDTLRWSYGAVIGTHSGDYWGDVKTTKQFTAKVDSSGACAIFVDTYAYAGTHDAWKSFVSPSANAGSPAVVSTDPQHRYLLFTVTKK